MKDLIIATLWVDELKAVELYLPDDISDIQFTRLSSIPLIHLTLERIPHEFAKSNEVPGTTRRDIVKAILETDKSK